MVVMLCNVINSQYPANQVQQRWLVYSLVYLGQWCEPLSHLHYVIALTLQEVSTAEFFTGDFKCVTKGALEKLCSLSLEKLYLAFTNPLEVLCSPVVSLEELYASLLKELFLALTAHLEGLIQLP